jgi:hypothetical protein
MDVKFKNIRMFNFKIDSVVLNTEAKVYGDILFFT